jgi:hypothetical protein
VPGEEIAAALRRLWGRKHPATWNRNRAAVVSWLNWSAQKKRWPAPQLPPDARATETLALNVEDLDLEERRAAVRSKGGNTEFVYWGTDQSRYLVDPALAAQYQQSFFTKTLELVDLPGTAIYTWDKAFAAALSAYQQNNNEIQWLGYWGDEFRNIAFPGERQAAELSMKRFQVYERDDRKLRKLNNTGQLVAAITFDTSYKMGSSNWAFSQYDDAQVQVIDIDENAFNQAIADGLHALDGWTVIPG